MTRIFCVFSALGAKYCEFLAAPLLQVVPKQENYHWFELRPRRTPVVRVMFAEVSKIKSGLIPNCADPMVEWFFHIFSRVVVV